MVEQEEKSTDTITDRYNYVYFGFYLYGLGSLMIRFDNSQSGERQYMKEFLINFDSVRLIFFFSTSFDHI